MDRVAIIQQEKIVETMARFPFEEKIETMDRVGYNTRSKNL